jgi:PPOX class probable F420-dependent enzyme
VTPADQLRRGRHVIVTTYRRDGRPVPTIVGSVVDEQGRVCMRTRPGSREVKRIGNNPAVNVTPCDGQGGRSGQASPEPPGSSARTRRPWSGG